MRSSWCSTRLPYDRSLLFCDILSLIENTNESYWIVNLDYCFVHRFVKKYYNVRISQMLVLLQLFFPIIIVMIIDNVLNCFAVLCVRKCMHILPSKSLSLSLLEKFFVKKREKAERHRWRRPVVDSSKNGRKKRLQTSKAFTWRTSHTSS